MALTATSTNRRSDSTYLLRVISGVAIVAGLYFGKELLVPFALALLFSFLLSAPVSWLQKYKLKKPIAVSLVLTATAAIVLSFAWLGIQELAGIISDLPQYRANMLHKLQSVRNPAGLGLTKLVESLDGLRSVAQSEKGPEQKPVPVHVVSPAESVPALGPFGFSVLSAIASAFAVAVLTLFMLLNREHLRNRLLRLMGQGRLLAMTTALDDAAQRVSQYLLTQSFVNSAFGTVWALGLYFIGVPYAVFWGVAAAMLRFIPYVGTFFAGVCPVIVASIALTGWRRPLMAAALYACLEGLVSSVIEPWLYATRTGISSLAILLSAAFWTLLWGPIGLILSTPLTVCLAVVGRHIPALEFLYVILGDEAALSEDVRLYQRLLAQDEDEAAQVLEESLKTMSITELFDKVVIPALSMAEQDRHGGNLDQQRADYILATARELIADVSETAPHPEAPRQNVAVGCMAARDEADAVVTTMLVNTLQTNGFEAWAVQSTDELRDRKVDVVIVSALPPLALLPARSLCRKIRKSHGDFKVVLGVWNSDSAGDDIRKRLGATCIDSVVTSLQQAVERAGAELEIASLESV